MLGYAEFTGTLSCWGRMIPALELSVDGVVDGLRAFLEKKTTSSESIFFSFNIIEKNEFWKGIWKGAYLVALKKLFFQECECVASPLFVESLLLGS